MKSQRALSVQTPKDTKQQEEWNTVSHRSKQRHKLVLNQKTGRTNRNLFTDPMHKQRNGVSYILLPKDFIYRTAGIFELSSTVEQTAVHQEGAILLVPQRD
jgi:hypothetical protein